MLKKILQTVLLVTFMLASAFGWSKDRGEELEPILEQVQEQEQTQEQDKQEAFESYLDGLVAAQFNDYQLAGITVAVIQDGSVKLKKGYGVADITTGEAVDPDRHLFRPGSVSKLFTWTAVMQLVERDKLKLDDDLSQYVPQFVLPNVFGKPLTMKHLMTHTPGLEDGAAGYLFAKSADEFVGLANSLAMHMPNQVREPGQSASYSNWGTALAGLVVANISCLSFEEYVQQNIFDPLDMTQATFDEPLPNRLAEDMVTGYVTEQGVLTPLGFEYIKNFGPAGALSASSDSMIKFMLAHLNEGSYEGQQILKPETVVQMHSELASHDERVNAMAHGFYETYRGGQRFIGHGGDTIAFHSELLLDPTKKFGLFYSSNSPDGAAARAAIVNGIVDFFYGQQQPVYDFPAPSGSAERVAEVAGTYRLNRRSYTELEGVVAFMSDFSVAPAGEDSIYIPVPQLGGIFKEIRPYEFQKPGSDARFVFDKDADGNIERALIASLPIVVADRIGAHETAANHTIVIVLTLLAGLFLVINTTRNWKIDLPRGLKGGRRWVTATAASNLLFLIVWGGVLSGIDMNEVIFEFPPPGTGFALIFPIISLICTAVCLTYIIPVWKAKDANIWVRLRYSYVTLVFVLFVGVLYYWNLIGWNY